MIPIYAMGCCFMVIEVVEASVPLQSMDEIGNIVVQRSYHLEYAKGGVPLQPSLGLQIEKNKFP